MDHRIIHIATEDALSEAVAERLIHHYSPRFKIHSRYGRGGNGNLRSKLKSYFQIAERTPLLLITDLDSKSCAPSLISDWTQSVNIDPPANMLFRIAIREIESWLLADHSGMKTLLNASKLPANPDILDDPKKALLLLAKKAPRDVREDLVSNRNPISQGLGYNARLTEFVRNCWNPDKATERSDSLKRCCQKIQELNKKA